MKSQKIGWKSISKIKNVIKKTFPFIISLILLGFFFRYTYSNNVITIIKNANIYFLMLAGIVFLFIPFVKALRFGMLIKNSIEFNKKQNILIHYIVPIAGFFTPGRIGEGVKVLVLKDKRKYAAFFFLIEKILEMLAILVFSIIGLILFGFDRIFIVTVILVTLILVVITVNIKTIGYYLFKIIKRRKLARSIKNYSINIGIKEWFYIIMFTLIRWTLDFLTVYFIALAVGIKLNFFVMSFAFSVSTIMGFLSGLPGGLGVREFSILFILERFFSISRDLVFSFNILLIFIPYSLAIAGYIIGTIIYNRLRTQF